MNDVAVTEAALLDEIYAAPSESARWETVLASLCEICEASGGAIYSPKLPGGPRRGLGAYVGYKVDVDYYVAHAQAHILDDPFSPAMWAAVGGDWRRVAGALASEPGEAALSSDFYQIYQRGLDIGDTLSVMLRPPSPTQPTPVLSLFRPWDGKAFDATDIARLQVYAPHLQRAAWIEFEVQPASGPGPSVTLIADQLPPPVLFLDHDRRVVHANPAARRLLAVSGALIQLRGGGLRIAEAGAQARLDQAIDLAFGLEGQLASIAEALLTSAGTPPVIGRVVPFPAGEPFVHEGGRLRAAIILISRRQSLPGLARFTRLFGLSAIESEIAAALLNGETPDRIARDRGRSIETVRSQIRGVITKTGVDRASEIAMLRPLGEYEL